MSFDEQNSNPVDLEDEEPDAEQAALREAAQTDKVVRGVNGTAERRRDGFAH